MTTAGGPDSLLTREGDVFGTLSYMAPEQLRGETATLDRRADVWSTGVTLFEVLTGERPFSGKSPGELAVSIEGGAAKDPVALNPLLAGDVAVVMGKALEPSVDRRYSTALGFAEDLRRICEYEPIHARPAGPLLRFRRWCRREPAWAATLGVTLVALVGGLSVALVALDEMRSLYNQAKSEILVNHVNSKTSEPPAGRLAVGLAASDLEDSWTVRSALVPLVLDLTLQSYFPLSRPAPLRQRLHLGRRVRGGRPGRRSDDVLDQRAARAREGAGRRSSPVCGVRRGARSRGRGHPRRPRRRPRCRFAAVGL